jgi:hypothetical protein
MRITLALALLALLFALPLAAEARHGGVFIGAYGAPGYYPYPYPYPYYPYAYPYPPPPYYPPPRYAPPPPPYAYPYAPPPAVVGGIGIHVH